MSKCQALRAKCRSVGGFGEVYEDFEPCRTGTKNGMSYCFTCLSHMAVDLFGGECDSEMLNCVSDSSDRYSVERLNMSVKWDLREAAKGTINRSRYNEGKIPVTFCAKARALPEDYFFHSINHDFALVISRKGGQYELIGLAGVGTSVHIYEATPRQKKQFFEIVNK